MERKAIGGLTAKTASESKAKGVSELACPI